ncbi:hypothetical protein BC629DRAFT_1473253, partial [Irpex lacteus]
SAAHSPGDPNSAVPVRGNDILGKLPPGFDNIPLENPRISSTFHFNAALDRSPNDTLVLSTDGVIFVLHSQRLLSSSTNHFASLIPSNGDSGVPRSRTLRVRESSDCLNVVLHTFYGLSCDVYRPTHDCIMSAIPALKVYGMNPLAKCLSRNMPLFKALMAHAESHAVEIYALAAAESLEDLAVASSAFTLGVDLHLLSNDLIRKIPASPNCCGDQWQTTNRDYKLACMDVLYAATLIETIMNKCINSISCSQCKAAAESQVREACAKWTSLKVS